MERPVCLVGLHVDQFINRNVFVEGFGQIGVNVTRCEGLLNETMFILEGADEELVHYLLVQALLATEGPNPVEVKPTDHCHFIDIR